MESPLLDIEGTPYLRTIDGRLRRALRLRLPVTCSGPAQVRIRTHSEELQVEAELEGGTCLACGPAGWQDHEAVSVSVVCSAGEWTGQATPPPTRPWTIYIAQDKHLDYGWIHPVEQVVERMNNLLDYYLDANARTGLHWNLDVSIWVEEYLRGRPSARGEKLLDALRAGALEVGALWLVPFPGLMGTEEWLQSLYYARHLEEALGVPMRTASLQEVPSAPWGLPTILAGAGIKHLVKGAYDLRNPHLAERDPNPLCDWEGPDGSRVRLKWDPYAGTSRWGGYAEAYILWRGKTEEEKVRFIEDTIARYDAFAGYPLDAILLAGTGFDEYPQTTAVSDFIRRFNAQGWEYPRLVDSTWSGFWQVAEEELARGAQVPVQRGDWGTSWEEWPAQLAHLNAIYRQARETALAGQALSALAYGLDPATHPARKDSLAAAWRGLLQFADHNIGGIGEPETDDMRDRKATYVYTARREAATALQSAIAVVAGRVAAPADGRTLVVANPNSWERSGLVEVVVPELGAYGVTDVASGRVVPCQIETRGQWPEHYLSFLAAAVPAFGYCCFAVRRASGEAAPIEPQPAGFSLENHHYALALDPETGSVRSLTDRATGRELVNPQMGYGLNEYVQRTGGTLHKMRLEKVTLRKGTVSSRLTAELSCGEARLQATYVLHEGLARLDIMNKLARPACADLQTTWFAFPLNLAGHEYHYDGPAAILRPGLQSEGGDLLPGSGRACIAAQSFLSVSDAEGGVVIALPDAHLIQLGEQALHDPFADPDPRSPLALSAAMLNWTRNDHAVDQGGQTRFTFRYSVSGYAGPFDAPAAVRMGKEVAQPLAAAWATGDADVPSGAASRSFLSVSPENLVATGLKAAEDGRGWILRLWECAGRAAEAIIDAAGLGVTQAWECDLLERTQAPLPVEDGAVHLAVPAWRLRAVRLV